MSDTKLFSLESLENLSVKQVIDKNASEKADDTFLINPLNENTLTYKDLQKACRSLGVYLQGKGFQKGDAIAFAMNNSPETVLIILGALYNGYLTTAVNLVSGKKTISYVLSHSESRLVFVDDQSKPLIEEAISEVQGKKPIIALSSPALFENDVSIEHELNAGDDGLLMYTSGTTGVPKGVVLTHEALLNGGGNVAFAHQLTQNDRALCVLPLYHINGLCVTIMAPLVTGSSVVLPPKFSVSNFWDKVKTYQCSWFSVVPTQISYLLHEAEKNGHNHDGLEKLRFARSASAPLSPDVQRAFEQCFKIPVIETMGLTETAAQILSNPMPPGTRKIGSPGIAFGNEIIVADINQKEIPHGEEGEVLVRGKNVMRCYLKNEEATKVSLTDEGWLRTGDLGRMDEDGYVYITGRLKELIIKGGENIAPREIDEALYTHPDVIEAAAFACECKQYGQRVEAGVMLKQGSPVNEDDLIHICQKLLGKFKSPDRVHFMPELPKGPSGKIQRRKLAELYAN